MNFLEELCDGLQRWVNHPKNGGRRCEEDLEKFDDLWAIILRYIRRTEKKEDLTDFESDFIKMVKYTGTLYRFHVNYNKKLPNYGIEQTYHYLGWTKTNNLDDFYWLHNKSRALILETEATDYFPGIDLVGLSEHIAKYEYPNFKLGYPAVIKEQEVVFPLMLVNLSSVKENSTGKLIKLDIPDLF